MSTSTFTVTVTEELLSNALPEMREALQLAAQKRHTDYMNSVRWLMFALGVVLLPLSSLLILGSVIHIFAPSDVPRSQAIFYGIFAVLGMGLGVTLVLVFVKRREYRSAWGSRIQNWSIGVSVRRLLDKTPFEVNYRLSKDQIEAQIDVLEIHRCTLLSRVRLAYLCDYFCALYTGGYFQPLRWIYFESQEQRKNIEKHLRGVGLDIVSLTPIVVADLVH